MLAHHLKGEHHANEHPVYDRIERFLCPIMFERVGRLKFGSVVVLANDALVRRARGLMPLPGGGYVDVQRIPSRDLATFVDRAVDGVLPSSGDLGNIRDETCPVSRDRLSIRPPTDEEHLGTRNLQTICGPPGSNTTPMVTDTKLGGTSLARQLLRSTRTGLLMMVGLPCCAWSDFCSKNTVLTD